jgi:hypothetical protein
MDAVAYPLGLDAMGHLAYTPDGYVFVSIMRTDRPPFASQDLLGGTSEERARAAGSFVAYCGRYELRDGRVVHHIEQSLFPNWVGTSQERFVQVNDDQLTITTAPYEVDGTVTSRVVWVRATPAAARLA